MLRNIILFFILTYSKLVCASSTSSYAMGDGLKIILVFGGIIGLVLMPSKWRISILGVALGLGTLYVVVIAVKAVIPAG